MYFLINAHHEYSGVGSIVIVWVSECNGVFFVAGEGVVRVHVHPGRGDPAQYLPTPLQLWHGRGALGHDQVPLLREEVWYYGVHAYSQQISVVIIFSTMVQLFSGWLGEQN